MAKDVLKKKIDKLNPFSDINKEKTKQAKKDKAELKQDIAKWKQKIGVARAQIEKLPKTSR